MSEPYIGQIIMFAGNFAIRSYANCEGQLLPINQNTALFSILGTTYGGDGRTTFALPDLRGRFATQQGTGPGLPTYRLGERGGIFQKQLATTELPSHNHNYTPQFVNALATDVQPGGKYLAGNPDPNFAPGSAGPLGNMGQSTTANQGGGQNFSIMNPFLAINFQIALFGLYPPRN